METGDSAEQAKEANNAENVSSKRNQINDIIYSVKPALIVENLFGIYRFGVNDAGFVPTNGKMKLIGIVMTSIYTCLFLALLDIPTVTSTGSLVDAIDEIPSVVIVIQYIASVISTQFFLCATTIQIFTAFMKLDSVLLIDMNVRFYSKSRSLTIRYLMFLFLTHTVFIFADVFTDETLIVHKLITLTLYFEQDLEMFVFCKLVFMLKKRLNVINEYLMKFIHEKDSNKTPIFVINEKVVTSDNKYNFIGRISPSNIKIRDLAEMYDTIGHTCYLINEVFEFQIFMNLVSTFLYVIITIWTSLYYFRMPDNPYGSLITVVCWSILTILSVTVMSFTCESLLSTRNNTKVLVNELIMDYDLPRNMRIQAKVFMELIEAWPLRIFVYDMFSVDIKLMLKFISVATTYLIVIIQISHFV